MNTFNRAVQDNPDLPPAFIKESLKAKNEVKAGKVTKYKRRTK